MRFAAAVFVLSFLTLSALGKGAREEPKVIEQVTPLPVALDKNFEFRKTKLFFLSDKAPKASERARQTTSSQPAAAHDAMPIDRNNCVLRAGGQKPARSRKIR